MKVKEDNKLSILATNILEDDLLVGKHSTAMPIIKLKRGNKNMIITYGQDEKNLTQIEMAKTKNIVVVENNYNKIRKGK